MQRSLFIIQCISVRLIFSYYVNPFNYYRVLPQCQPYQCSVPVYKRRDCSPGATSRDNCLALGCCFDNSKFDTVWCFHPLGVSRNGKCPHPECQVIPDQREPCYHPKLSHRKLNSKGCVRDGCCYQEDSYGSPMCFKRKVYAIGFPGLHILFSQLLMKRCSGVEPSRRKLCARNKDQCLRFHCCWLDIALEGPQCFYPLKYRLQ